VKGPITFATLGGGESTEKGAELLLETARRLEAEARAGRFRLLVKGHVTPGFAAQVRGIPGVEIGGSFRPDELDLALAEVDVGLMPSLWEEAYGYAGIEFLAKGIPVIANAVGALPEYVQEGATGWLNQSCDAEGLAEIMRGVIEHPRQVVSLNETLRVQRDSLITTLAQHAKEMDAVYRSAISEGRA
jgi:glycosyltransferase involved in cell wall biosynthesis